MLTDEDLERLIELRANEDWKKIDELLHEEFRQIVC